MSAVLWLFLAAWTVVCLVAVVSRRQDRKAGR